MKRFIPLFLLISFFGFGQNKLKPGTWRGVLTLSEKRNEIILPFNFNVRYLSEFLFIDILNAEEKITVTEIIIAGDSVNFKMPVFDSEFKTVLKNDTLRGLWINNSKKEKNKIPFEAYYNDKKRFITSAKPNVDFSGQYEVTFNPKTSDEYKSIGIFKQNGNKITGTFLTETGDYRYLEGDVQNNDMSLSCFDGAHAFLFFAGSSKKTGKADSINGKVFYGISGTEDWVAVRNEKFKLKDPEGITTLKSPNEKVSFSFPNLEKQTVTLNDQKFNDKVVVIQIMGSWCPNCMDETAYLSKVYKQYKGKGLEIVALAYEKTDDFERSKKNISRLRTKYGVEYEMLITGLIGKAKASESLPFLNSISAFPTTLILDRKHNVKSIYTGFNGPATGKEFELYKAKTESLLTQLLLKKD
ncbi:MAG TPA: TlpA disulfide reductase family protein [Bacteroidia bacterium]|jgi:thiol-disulfide isomerase/thioredoxin|nr:TlpA disulfide reductase family protein [Bacteroidia bacterium]